MAFSSALCPQGLPKDPGSSALLILLANCCDIVSDLFSTAGVYQDEVSVAAKGQYVTQYGLGGTIIWQLHEGYNPSAPDPISLLYAVGVAFIAGTDPTTTSLRSSVQLAVFGQPVTVTAVVTSTAGVPDGSGRQQAVSRPARLSQAMLEEEG